MRVCWPAAGCEPTYKTPKCRHDCEDGSVYTNSKHYTTSAFHVRGIEKIQTEIMTNGPLEVSFTVRHVRRRR